MSERMDERQLAAIIDEAERDGLTNSGTFSEDQRKYLQYYQTEKVGVLASTAGESSVVSTDVRDLVEADMPSLARVFLGAGDPVAFKADTPSPEAIQEAKDKQTIVSHIIKTIPNSYRTQHAWLKSSEIQDMAVLEYGVKEIKTAKYKRYKGLNPAEHTKTINTLEKETDVEKVEITEKDEEKGSILVRITYVKNQYFMNNIPVDDLIISRNAWNKDDAEVIGKRFTKTRSELVAEGFTKKEVAALPTYETTSSNENNLKAQRYKQQGGEEGDTVKAWANEQVRGEDVYILVDYDNDGIAERRHVIKVGTVILENEPFDHVPYAISSSMLMPNNLVGVCRSQLAMVYQDVNSTLWRGTLNNMYAAQNPRHIYNDNVDVDDLLDIRLNGTVFTDGNPFEDVATLRTEYTGDKTIQVIQYMEGRKVSSTGSINQNQALEADQLQEETATRFKGMEDAATAKIELVARCLAETGYRDLWEGFAWFATHFQDSRLERRVLGHEIAFDPAEWRFDHSIVSKVGTGAGDDEKTMTNLSGIFQAQTSLKNEGSMLVDEKKRYNTLSEMVRIFGRDDPSEFFNNPEEPDEIVRAERDMLKKLTQQLEANQQDPLAAAAKVEADGKIAQEQLKQKFQGQIKQMEMQADFNEKLRAAELKFQKENDDLRFKYAELAGKLELEYTKIETENQVDIPGKGANG